MLWDENGWAILPSMEMLWLTGQVLSVLGCGSFFLQLQNKGMHKLFATLSFRIYLVFHFFFLEKINFRKFYLFSFYWEDKGTGRDKKRTSNCWFSFSNVLYSLAGSCWSQELRSHTKFLSWVSGIWGPEPLSAASSVLPSRKLGRKHRSPNSNKTLKVLLQTAMWNTHPLFGLLFNKKVLCMLMVIKGLI